MLHFRLLRLIAPDGRGITAGVLIGLVLSTLALLQAVSMSTLFSGIVDGSTLVNLALPFALLAVALLLRPFATAAREIIAHGVASRMKRDLRGRILDDEAARGPFTGEADRLGARHALLVEGVENLEPYVTRYLPQIIITTISAAVAVAMLFVIDPIVGAAAGIIAIFVPLIPRLWDAALRGRGEEHWSAYSSLHADVVDALRGMETLKLLGAADRRRAELSDASDALLIATLRQLRLSLIESGLTGFLLVAGPAAALTVAVARVMSGSLDPEALFAVALIGFEVFRPFRELSAHWHAGYLGVTAGSRLMAQLSSPPPAPTAPVTNAQPSPGTAIELRHVRARYPDAARPALDGVSLRIPRGSVTAIVGPSGAGKSTVANVLLGLLTPEEGDISIAAPAGAVPIALVSQDPVLFSGTLRENLALVSPDSDDSALLGALERAQCTELASLSGLDAQVGDGGSLLSGGQRQRASIARALLRGSPVLLLDEASSALDARRERALLDGLRTTAQENDLTVIIIAHRLTAIRSADLIIVMDRGHVHEQGTYDALASAGGLFTRLHAAQSERVGA